MGNKLNDDYIPHLIGISRNVYIPYFQSKFDFDPEVFRKIQKEIINNLFPEVEFYSVAVEVIKELHSSNIPLALATSASSDGTKKVLNLAGLENIFKTIVTRDDVTKHKPDPEVYLKAAEQLQIDPSLCVAMEDTSLGVEAAKQAGMYCFAIPNEYTKEQDFSKADKILKTAKEILGLLEFVM